MPYGARRNCFVTFKLGPGGTFMPNFNLPCCSEEGIIEDIVKWVKKPLSLLAQTKPNAIWPHCVNACSKHRYIKRPQTRHIIPNKPIHLRVLDRVVGVDYRYLAVSVQTARNAYWHRDQAKSGSSPLFVHLRSTSDIDYLLCCFWWK